MKKKIAVTIGDANSIGAEVAIKALEFISSNENSFVLYANSDILKAYNLKLPKNIEIEDIAFDIKNLEIGKSTRFSGEFAYKTLETILTTYKEKNIGAIVTAPVSKEALNLAGYNFSGQTEILEKFLSSKSNHAEMFFLSKDMKVLLLTRHVKLKDVTKTITKEFFEEKILRLNEILKSQFKIQKPKIAICAINPHAGENGLLGKEENDILIPVISELNKRGLDLSNPIPADALFKKIGKYYLNNENQPYDCYVSMYHDQGLCAVKALTQENCVNMTAGLDIIRTSPAHGTAYDIAGKNIANPISMLNAIEVAQKYL